MKTAAYIVAFAAFSLMGCTAETGTEEVSDTSEEALTAGTGNFGYWVVTRRDSRKCVSPLCGGFFAKRLNLALTTCADGSKQAECYVSGVDLAPLGLSEREASDLLASVAEGKALVKARVRRTKFGATTIGSLAAVEGWLGATGSAPDGTFFRAARNGLVCKTAPCPTTTAFTLNTNDSHPVIDTILTSTTDPASAEALDRAARSLGTKQGILVAGGLMLPKCAVPSPSCGPKVIATEFYLPVVAREGKACGGRGMSSCGTDQFCYWKAGDICGAADAPGTCIYRPEMCIKIYKPVCGCNGKTYGNECMARAAGASVVSNGACP